MSATCPFCTEHVEPLEQLLRECAMTYGHIQLFRDEAGWQASVYHYSPKKLTHNGKAKDDPVEALRAALIEDERLTRDVQRRYDAAVKAGPIEQVADADGFCLICEGGGCDLCRAGADDFEDIFG